MKRVATAMISLLLGCPSHPATNTVSLTPLPSAPSASPASQSPGQARVTSADGSFSLAYPRGTFPGAKAHGDGVEVTSRVSEPGMGEGDGAHFYAIAVTRLRGSLLDALRTAIDEDSFHQAFPDGTEASFHASPGFFEREAGGYHVSIGVEGVGDEIHVFSTGDGQRWRFDCKYCCGLVTPPPKISREDQVALCGTLQAAFEAEHLRPR